MFSKEQKDIALRLYHQTESVTKTIRILGYPTRRNLYKWISEEKNAPGTFSHSVYLGFVPFVFSLISLIILIAS